MAKQRKRSRVFSLSTPLAAMGGVLFCALFAHAFLSVRHLDAKRQQRAITLVEKAEAIYSTWMQGQLATAEVLASRPEIARVLHHSDTPGAGRQVAALLEQTHEETKDLFSYIAVVRLSKPVQDVVGVSSLVEVAMLADSNGIGNARYDAENDVVLHAMFRAGQRKRGPARYKNGLPHCFTLALPLLDAKGSLAGALSLGVPVQSLNHALDQADLSEGALQFMIVDSSGRVLFSTRKRTSFANDGFEARALLPHLGSKGVSSFTRPVDDAPCEFFAKAVDTALSGADSWWFVVRKPVLTPLGALGEASLPLALSLFGLVLCLFLGWPKKQVPEKTPPLARGIAHPLLATSPLIFILCNTETGRVTAVSKNARRLFDCFASELAGKTLDELFVSGIPERNGPHEISLRTRRGKILNIACICHYLRSPEVLLYIDDNRTDAKQKQHVSHLTAELAAANLTAGILREDVQHCLREKAAFTFGLCASLRENMDSLLGLVHLLENSGLNHSQNGYLKKLSEANFRLFSTLNETLEFVRFEQGEVPPECAPFDPGKLLVGVYESFKGKAAEGNQHVLIKYDNDIPHLLKGDAPRLKQVLTEVLDFFVVTVEGGAILLNCRLLAMHEKTASLGFSVCGKNLVLGREDRNTFFEPFAFLECLPASVAPGINLALARYFVFHMGGVMEMRSSPKEGTTVDFICHFPLADDADATADLSLDPPFILNRYSLLVAEKNQITRNVLIDTLEHGGASVVAVSNGADLLKSLENPTWNFDALLVNLELPDMEGHALIRKIREQRPASSLPIIALNEQPRSEQRMRAFLSGMNDLVENPLDSAPLYSTVRRWVEASRSMR